MMVSFLKDMIVNNILQIKISIISFRCSQLYISSLIIIVFFYISGSHNSNKSGSQYILLSIYMS